MNHPAAGGDDLFDKLFYLLHNSNDFQIKVEQRSHYLFKPRKLIGYVPPF